MVEGIFLLKELLCLFGTVLYFDNRNAVLVNYVESRDIMLVGYIIIIVAEISCFWGDIEGDEFTLLG